MSRPTAPSSFDRRRQLLEAAGWNPHQLVACRLTAGADVLDVACGGGDFLAGLREAGARVGIDRDRKAIVAARHAHPGIEFRVADVTDLPPDGRRFGAVTLLHALLHFPDAGRSLRRCREAMAPGGTLWATSNSEGHLGEFWEALSGAAHADPELAPLFRRQPGAVPLEARLTATLAQVFGAVQLEIITGSVALTPPAALELLGTYRDAFACSDAAWQRAEQALGRWLTVHWPRSEWTVKTGTALAWAG